MPDAHETTRLRPRAPSIARGARSLVRLVLCAALVGADTVSGAQLPAPIRAVAVGEIGCLDCAGAAAFGSVQAVAIGRGRIVVADRDAPHLRAFDLEGELLATGGATGDGPGEFRLPLAVAVTPDGVAAVDMRRMRVSLLDDRLRETAGERMGGFPMTASFAPGTDVLYVTLTDFRSGNAAVSRWEPGSPWIEVEDTLEAIPFGDGVPPPILSLAQAPDGTFAVGMGADRYRLFFYDAEGRLAHRAERALPRTRKTDEEIAAQRDQRVAALARLGGGAPSPERQALAAAAPEVDPLRLHFRSKALAFDGEGRLWVRTDRAPDGTTFDVFDGDARFLGEVHVPERVDAFGLGDGYLVGAVNGDLDVATLRIWRLEPARS